MQLKKALLATAITVFSTSAFAMQSMDDEALASTTGQDGLTVTITPDPVAGIGGDIIWHDTDGFGGASAGAVVITGFNMQADSGIELVIDADGDQGGATAPGLRVGVNLLGATTISTGAITVATSNGVGAAVSNQTATLLNSMDINIGAGSLATIYLGNEPVGGAMINVATTLTGGLSITNFALNDVSVGGGSIAVGTVAINNAGASADLAADLDINADATDGLVIDVNTLGTGGLDVALSNVALGTATVMGDVEIRGLNLTGSTIAIKGH